MAAASDSTGPSRTATATELITAEHALHGAPTTPATDGAGDPAEAWGDDEIGPPPVPLVPLVKEAALARPVHPVTGR
jgi:hypothetical protein